MGEGGRVTDLLCCHISVWIYWIITVFLALSVSFYPLTVLDIDLHTYRQTDINIRRLIESRLKLGIALLSLPCCHPKLSVERSLLGRSSGGKPPRLWGMTQVEVFRP